MKTRIKFEVDNVLTAPTAWSVFVQPPQGQASFVLVFGIDSELAQNDPGDYTWSQSTSYTTGLDHGMWIYDVVSSGLAQGARGGSFPVDEHTVPK
ncbi:MAG: hypothetical protein V3W41_22140 [Planctomycetota bacterium]